MILYQTIYPHKDIAISSYEGSPNDTLMVNLKKGDYLLDTFDASFNNSCTTISLNRSSGKYKPNSKKSSIMAKPISRRTLLKRQYY